MEYGTINKIYGNRRKALLLSGRLNGLGITGFIVIRNREHRKQIMIVNNIPNAKKEAKQPQ